MTEEHPTHACHVALERICALEKVLELRMRASEDAVVLGREVLNTRLEHSNGLIEMMRQQSHEMATKIELHALSDRVVRIEKQTSTDAGRSAGYQPLINIGMLVIAAIIAYLAARIAA